LAEVGILAVDDTVAAGTVDHAGVGGPTGDVASAFGAVSIDVSTGVAPVGLEDDTTRDTDAQKQDDQPVMGGEVHDGSG
jgi:hypothetical protein